MIAKRRKAIVREFLIGLGVTILLLVVHLALGATTAAQWLDGRWTQTAQAVATIWPSAPAKPDIVIVNMDQVATDDGCPRAADPAQLQCNGEVWGDFALLAARIAAFHPAAIGIDNNFSPINRQAYYGSRLRAFDADIGRILQLAPSQRVYLGIAADVPQHLDQREAPDPNSKGLLHAGGFASVNVPDDIGLGMIRQRVALPTDPNFQIYSMGATLFAAWKCRQLQLEGAATPDGACPTDGPIRVEQLLPKDGPLARFDQAELAGGLSSQTTFVTDLAITDHLAASLAGSGSWITVSKGDLDGRSTNLDILSSHPNAIVLVGDPQRDQQRLSGRDGVTINAAAIEVIANGGYLTLRSIPRILIDVAIAIVALGIVALVRLRYAGREDVHVRYRALFFALLLFASLIIVSISMFVTMALHVVWDDILIVVALLLLHPFVEPAATAARDWTARTARSLWNRFFVAPGSAGE